MALSAKKVADPCSKGCENNSLQRSIIMFPTLGAKEQCFKGSENNWSADPMGVFTTIVPQKVAKITPITCKCSRSAPSFPFAKYQNCKEAILNFQNQLKSFFILSVIL